MINNKDCFYDKYHLEDDLDDIIWDLGSRHTRKIILDLVELKKGKVLDVGAGLGVLLSELNSFEKYALECSEATIGQGRGIYKNINWALGDAQQLPFDDNFFDLVISSHTLEHILNDKKAVEEMHRVLKARGQLILYLPSNSKGILKKELIEKNGHYRTYTKKSVFELLDKNLIMEKCIFPDRFLGFFWSNFRKLLVVINTIIKMLISRNNFVYYFRRFALRQNLSDRKYSYDNYQFSHTNWYRKFILPILVFIIYAIDMIFSKSSSNVVGFLNKYEQIICISAKKNNL